MMALYHNSKTAEIDKLAAQALAVDSFGLMLKAGAALFEYLKDHHSMLVITGPGNNGGDGFVVAELARQHGIKVTVVATRPLAELTGDALLAAQQFQGHVYAPEHLHEVTPDSYDVLVDALFGTGLSSPVRAPQSEVIDWINQQPQTVVSIDIPSGLHGGSGQRLGQAVKANLTISVITLNTGLFTLAGKSHCGDVELADLGLTTDIFSGVEADGWLLSAAELHQLYAVRNDAGHKGSFGHVLTLGGQAGMLGAVLLAGQAVLKAGAGATTVVTDSAHAEMVPTAAPELMTWGFDASRCDMPLQELLERKAVDVVLLGMGMGRSNWSRQMYAHATAVNAPLVIDADGLYWLSAAASLPPQLAVITPHPKEAARLLDTYTAAVQEDRWQAVKALANKYHCVAILKGSGTLISDGKSVWCCPYGNANLATAGTGDVLAGMVAGLLAQGHEVSRAARLAVLWHAMVGEYSAYGLSLTASDLLASLHEVLP